MSNWGSYVQSGENWEKIDKAGSALSQRISCYLIHYPAFDKRLFECKCGCIFPAWQVEAALSSNDWSIIDSIHANCQSDFIL